MVSSTEPSNPAGDFSLLQTSHRLRVRQHVERFFQRERRRAIWGDWLNAIRLGRLQEARRAVARPVVVGAPGASLFGQHATAALLQPVK